MRDYKAPNLSERKLKKPKVSKEEKRLFKFMLITDEMLQYEFMKSKEDKIK